MRHHILGTQSAVLLCGSDFKPECVDVHSCARCRSLAQRHCCASPECAAAAAAEALPANGSGGVAVRWLHIPKCGSTLGISLLQYACTPALPAWHIVYMAMAEKQIDVRMAHAIEARRARDGFRCAGRLAMPFAGHAPVTPAELLLSPSGMLSHAAAKSARGGGLAAMFRTPSQRLISAFLDNYHAWGITRHASRTAMKHAAPTVDLWARFPGVAGCQVKMLNGLDCGALPPSRGAQDLLARAIRLLRSDAFVFVGLVERWRESVCLLHASLGRGTAPVEGEMQSLGHSRNSDARRGGGGCRLKDKDGVCYGSAGRGYNASVLRGFRDELDEPLYAAAEEEFGRRLRLHRVAGGPAGVAADVAAGAATGGALGGAAKAAPGKGLRFRSGGRARRFANRSKRGVALTLAAQRRAPQAAGKESQEEVSRM